MIQRKEKEIMCQGKSACLKYIEVAIALPVYNTFTYRVPENLSFFAKIGKRALVPFGRRRVTGYILGPSEDMDHGEIKLILDILDETPLFHSSMIPFFRWIADYYMYPIGEVIKNALPGGLNLYDFVDVAITEKGKNALIKDNLTPLQNEILCHLKLKSCGLKTLCAKLKSQIPNSLIQAMEKQNLIICKRELKGKRTGPKMERYVSMINPGISTDKLSAQKMQILHVLRDEGEISVKKLAEIIPTATRLIKPLEKAGYISIFNKRTYRDPFGESIIPDNPYNLTKEQEKAVSTVIDLLGKGFATCLLAGVTGSGKTEVYLQIAAEAIKRKISVLILVPEIVLISQMERRFRARFGDCVALLHSRLSAGEQYDQWMRIARQEVRIAIGARSALFAPFADMGIVIVDEEHDTSYKQETGLCYNARDLAIVRAKLMNGVALLGSATPSIQSYYNVKTKKFIELTLTKRVEKRPLPEITVVDLRKTRDVRGIGYFITSELYKALKQTLSRGEQTILFLNRRGFAGFPVCASCGASLTCKNCDISLTLHQKANAYKCHYCGYSLAGTSNCSKCGSSKIKLLGLGTEKVEEAVKHLFPDARVARLDRDTIGKKHAMLSILKGIKDHTTDILIGTQMVAKGHDFPNITLVGIICADLSLNFPDFRAGERTFQLLAQVSGRAGRGTVPGRVILQTYNPDHFSIEAAKNQDFKAFYNKEIVFRKALNYPPFSRIILLKISGKDIKKTQRYAMDVGDLCSELKNNNRFVKTVEILGPITAPLPRIAKHFRWQILIKGLSAEHLHGFVHQLLVKNRERISSRDVKMVIDVDPFFMM
ncbi:MAG: primosomal protein N' [Candidatus Desulfaltia sp.]|nr:primosomal protein N' [Candidatus Desulfaltia sp.]